MSAETVQLQSGAERRLAGRAADVWLAPALCAALALAWAVGRIVASADTGQGFSAPAWLPGVAAAVAALGTLAGGRGSAHRVGSALRWSGLFLLLWAANGLPFDILTAAGLIGRRTPSGEVVIATVDLPGLVVRALAFAAAVVVARQALASPTGSRLGPRSRWFGYAAFALALPYPVLRVHWALGGTVGLDGPGAAGVGWEPVVIAIPWMVAAVVSLLLAHPPAVVPRHLLLAAGWAGTTIVAMIGPAAVWSFIAAWASGAEIGSGGIAGWVFALFYGSWFLWAIAAAAATRACQVRSAGISAGASS